MADHATPEVSAARRERKLSLTVGARIGGLAAVLLVVALTVGRSESPVSLTEGSPILAAALILLAAWGVGQWLVWPSRAAPSDRSTAFVAWALAGVVGVVSVGWLAAEYPVFAVVETGLLACGLVGVLILLSDRGGVGPWFSRGASAVLVLGVIATAAGVATGGPSPTTIVSAAGAKQLAAAAQSGDTIRLHGRERAAHMPASGYRPLTAASCTTVPIAEVRRSALGFEEQRVEVGMTACWQGDMPYSLVVDQYARTPWGAATIETVLLRTASVFDADPLGATSADARRTAPKYGQAPGGTVDLAEVFGQHPPVLDGRGRVVDDGSGANDTVLARVAADGASVSVAAAFSISYPRLRSPDASVVRSPSGLQGSPAPKQLWFERVQPAGRDLIVVIGNVAKDGGSARLVRFTDAGQQPWAMTEVG